ncbi:MAG: PfkB family carbohydrate kinase [Planctomycetota bacterium]
MTVLINATLCIDTVEVPGVGKVEGVLGGAAAYFAAAARLFGPVRVLGAVGEDYPDELWAQLTAMGLDTAGIARRPGRTFRWHGRYHADLKHRDTLVVDFDPAVEAPPPVPEAWRDTGYVCLGVSLPENQLRLRGQFPGAALTVLDTIDLYVNRHREKLVEAIGAVHGVVVNDWEAERITGEADAARAAERLRGMAGSFAVVKRGADGAVLADAAGVWSCPAAATAGVVDPTGAGDSFLGGMLGYLASVDAGVDDTQALRRAVALGSAAASFTIEDFSLRRLAGVTRGEVEERAAGLSGEG